MNDQIASRHHTLWTALFDSIQNNQLHFQIINLFTLNTHIPDNKEQPYIIILEADEEHSITHNTGTITEILEQDLDSTVLSVTYINSETDDQMFFTATAVANFTQVETDES